MQIDSEQYNSRTDPCTVYVRILYHLHLNVTQSFEYHVGCQIHQRNHVNLFSARTFQLKVDQCYPTFHWSWNFYKCFH